MGAKSKGARKLEARKLKARNLKTERSANFNENKVYYPTMGTLLTVRSYREVFDNVDSSLSRRKTIFIM